MACKMLFGCLSAFFLLLRHFILFVCATVYASFDTTEQDMYGVHKQNIQKVFLRDLFNK